jgi:DNA helicase-2/ATP-dependent DNA helicase PcrA
MNTIDFEGDLNAEQFAAASAGDGPMLILAAAGTGKTRTLVYRVA